MEREGRDENLTNMPDRFGRLKRAYMEFVNEFKLEFII
jgi:hypothetical protein